MHLARLHLIDVRIAAKIEIAATAVRTEVVVAGAAVAGVRVVVAEAIAFFAGQRLVRQNLIEYPHHCRVIEEDL